MDIAEFKGEDFKVMVKSDGWKIGFLRYSERFSGFGVLAEGELQPDEIYSDMGYYTRFIIRSTVECGYAYTCRGRRPRRP